MENFTEDNEKMPCALAGDFPFFPLFALRVCEIDLPVGIDVTTVDL